MRRRSLRFYPDTINEGGIENAEHAEIAEHADGRRKIAGTFPRVPCVPCVPSFPIFLSVAGLEQSGHSLSAADAHGHDAVFRFAAMPLIGDRSDQARSGHSERMAD